MLSHCDEAWQRATPLTRSRSFSKMTFSCWPWLRTAARRQCRWLTSCATFAAQVVLHRWILWNMTWSSGRRRKGLFQNNISTQQQNIELLQRMWLINTESYFECCKTWCAGWWTTPIPIWCHAEGKGVSLWGQQTRWWPTQHEGHNGGWIAQVPIDKVAQVSYGVCHLGSFLVIPW